MLVKPIVSRSMRNVLLHLTPTERIICIIIKFFLQDIETRDHKVYLGHLDRVNNSERWKQQRIIIHVDLGISHKSIEADGGRVLE